jgi:lipopolysaccharide export system protein LptA
MEGRKKGMKRFLRIQLVAGVCLLFLLIGFVTAQERKAPGKGGDRKAKLDKPFGLTSSKAPIDITSDMVEADQKQNTVTFKGNVIGKQENITLYANVLTIHYDSESKGIKMVVATGNVKIVQLDRRATSQKVTFHQDENKVVLEGEAVIREGENVIRGERVIYYVEEERSVVEGGKGGRVSTTITPAKKEP